MWVFTVDLKTLGYYGTVCQKQGSFGIAVISPDFVLNYSSCVVPMLELTHFISPAHAIRLIITQISQGQDFNTDKCSKCSDRKNTMNINTVTVNALTVNAVTVNALTVNTVNINTVTVNALTVNALTMDI